VLDAQTIPTPDLHDLARFLRSHERLFVLTGAGCSTASGIPDYRDAQGAWKRRPPVTFAAFTGSEAVRRRYWARSTVGWPRMASAQPNRAHFALARLEQKARRLDLVTQNVDGLHARAGSERVLDLHGRIAEVRCLACGARSARADLQRRLLEANPGWGPRTASIAPDGDADLEVDTRSFHVPACADCGGVLKPDVVFFGENVPPSRVARAYAALQASDAVLVVGSSLRVFSGWRFVRAAHERSLPIAILNLGRTRADDVATLHVRAPCGEALSRALQGG
jgi:NAD-dependent SIR2 family protein deacetylase